MALRRGAWTSRPVVILEFSIPRPLNNVCGAHFMQDWTVHRGGAVVAENAKNLAIENSTFDQVGGNAILLSNHVVNSTVSDCEIDHPGDSGIVSLGSANLVWGTAPTYPDNITIKHNVIHDTGIFGKQTSCYTSMLSARATLDSNICYNSPRCGIN
eukprot:SAG11_NODE_8358_length_1025_cov_1.058315_2_plen_156_part_00